MGVIYLDNNSENVEAKCPYCGEQIEAEAKRCLCCGSVLRLADNSICNNQHVIYTKEQENQYRPLSNGIKVFITVICSIIPGIGQLIGVIMSIIYMNTYENVEDYADRRSFGLALLIASIIMFLLFFIVFTIIILAASLAIGF